MLSKLLTLREQVILGGLALALFTGSVTLVLLQDRGTPIASAPQQETNAAPAPAPASAVAPPRPEVVPVPPEAPKIQVGVAIVGAVRQPGLYYLDEGARVRDLIQRAEGLGAEAHMADIKTDAVLIDGTTLEIPTAGETRELYNPAPYLVARAVASVTEAELAAPAARVSIHDASGRININTADQAALESLPGIGPALATRIIAYRTASPFQSPEDLLNVSGIGEKKLAALRDLVIAE